MCEARADLAVPDLDAAPVFVNLAGGTRFAPWRPDSVYDLVGRLRRELAGQVPAAEGVSLLRPDEQAIWAS